MIQSLFWSYVFKNYGLQNIRDDAFITTVGTFGAVANGLSRSFWANLLDRYSLKYVYGPLLITQMIIGLTIDLIKESKPLYFIWIVISYWWLGGNPSITPTICAKLFGHNTGGKVYSIVMIFYIIPWLSALALSRSLYQAIGYGKIFYITAGWTWLR